MDNQQPIIPTPPRPDASLDSSALTGVAWATAAKWSTQVFAWAGTLIVARILTPSDFGLLTMASVFLAVVLALSEFGVGTAVVTLRELPDEELRQLNSFSILLGVCGTGVTALMAYPLGLFFRAPALPPVLTFVGFTFLISSFQIVPSALLRRELQFRTLAVIDVTRGLLLPLVTVSGALMGLRYWALALGSVVGVSIITTMTLFYRRVGFAVPRLSLKSHVMTYTRQILGSRLAWVIYQDGDFAVAGRRLGVAAAGDYGMAWTLATSPIEKVTMVLNDVTPSLFSAAQHDLYALRRYFLNLTEMLFFATFPVSVGIALVSVDLVTVALGHKWDGAALPLAILALYAGVRAVTSLFAHLFNATRETAFSMWTSVWMAIVLIAGFLVGSEWGSLGIASAWLIIHPAFAVISYARVRRVLKLQGFQYLKSLRLGLDGSIVMVATLLVFRYIVARHWDPAPRLAVAIPLGALVFFASTWSMHRARVLHIVDWIRRARGGKLGEA
jgi:O-antigen/teichoic acid export membrane protein